ncbi:MAG: hypothetical protein KIT27_12140 [Legionellales bacterium]|nr:hypothetical protein [Legionellales bacterium]
MYTNDDLEELKIDVSRAANAVFRDMDYPVLRILLDLPKIMKQAYDENNGEELIYLNNKGLWDIGQYIKHKISAYSAIPCDFFEKIEKNIIKHLKLKKQLYFSPDNLKRCLKLVELVDEKWFDSAARKLTWSYFVELLDEFDNAEDIQCFANKAIENNWSIHDLGLQLDRLF